MKIRIPRKIKQAANALLVSLVLGGILCVSVTGYLTVTEQQSFLSLRSQVWNMAITVVEAGIEEGIEHMDAYPTNPGLDGWSYDGTWYSHTTALPNGDSYTVYVINTNINQPVIIAKANVTAPKLFSKAASPFLFADIGLNQSAGTSVTRAVQVRTSRGALFTKAMVAKQTIDMNGNSILTDSFDSGNLFYSNYGHYDANHARDNGDIASNDNIVNSISIGNANIYGHVQTGPNGTASIGSQGGVGSHAWQKSNKGIEPNNNSTDPGQIWYSHDANFTFPDTSLPDTTSYNTTLPSGGDVVTVTINVSSNYVGPMSTYPTPPPWSGVNTNTSWASQNTYPGPQPQMSTNYSPLRYTCPNYPLAGTYAGVVKTNTGVFQTDKISCPGTCVYPGSCVPTSGGSGHFNYLPILSYDVTNTTYTYAVYSYYYANYTTNIVYTTNHYDHVFVGPGNTIGASGTGNYLISSSPSGSSIFLGNVNLAITGGLNMSGNDQITIGTGSSGDNSTLNLFSSGTSATIGGNGIANKSGYAQNFVMYCTPSVTRFSFNGNGEFIGVLVAPNANITMDGGGKANNDFEGALVINSVKMNGKYSFHYDEALGRMPSNGRLLVVSWDEINPNSGP